MINNFCFLLNTQDNNHSTGWIVIKAQCTNYSIGGMVIIIQNTIYSKRYHKYSMDVFNTQDTDYSTGGMVITLQDTNYFIARKDGNNNYQQNNYSIKEMVINT